MNYPAIICGISGLSGIFCFRKQEFRSHSKLAYNFGRKGSEMWDHLPEKGLQDFKNCPTNFTGSLIMFPEPQFQAPSSQSSCYAMLKSWWECWAWSSLQCYRLFNQPQKFWDNSTKLILLGFSLKKLKGSSIKTPFPYPLSMLLVSNLSSAWSRCNLKTHHH